jgi:polyisoprenoid-binding protein YceI
MKASIILAIILLGLQISSGQGQYMTNEGVVTFYSHTIIEDITATNEKVAAAIDLEKGAVAIIVMMDEFQFKKNLMQVHFNENYVESEKYPRATFSGRIPNFKDVDQQVPGKYEVEVEGEMTIHGITRDISTKGSIEVEQNGITANTKFMLNPEDYGITIPRVVRKNIAEKMEITATLVCHPK